MAVDLGKTLGRQVGPLPLGVWLLVAAGGLTIGYYFNTRASSGGKTEQVPLTEPGVGTGGGQFIYDPPTQVETPTTGITTNAQWAIQAKNWLISRGSDPGIATTAIDKYLLGQNRTLIEQGFINLVLIQFGAPPEEVPVPENPIPQVPKPTPPAPSKPVPIKSWTFYTVQRGDTPGKITAKFPGRNWFAIYVLNDRVGLRPDGTPGVMAHPYDLKPGKVLIIPTVPSGLVAKVPGPKKGVPPRYYTVTVADRGSLTNIGKKFGVHPWNIYTANDIVGRRADGSAGFLRSFSVKPGQRLIIPYQ